MDAMDKEDLLSRGRYRRETKIPLYLKRETITQ